MNRPAARFALLLCSIAVGVGCGSSSGQSCDVDEDCASGFCKADGTCGDGGDTDAGSDGTGSDGTSGVCTPNHDGVVDMTELPLAAGRMGTFRIATDATWDTAGVAMPNGQRRWDLSGALANDQDMQLALVAPTGTWWAGSFPAATYSSQLASTSDLRGVFAVDATQLTLLGVVSPTGGTYKTELEYDGPAHVLKAPLQAGATWSSSSTVSGYAQGAVVAYTEAYESRVDQVGTMVTPYGEFPVVRVATDLTRTSGFSTLATTRSFTWVAECFGPVATVTSESFETDDEFTDVAEVRRLAP
jgi:hypothetical protein